MTYLKTIAIVAALALAAIVPWEGASADETAATTAAAPVAADETLWSSIKDLSMPDLLQEFIKQYPESPHRAEAEAKLQALQATTDAVPASEQAAKLLAPDATVTRDVTAEAAPDTPAVDPQLVASVVAELDRCGCEPGAGDGTYSDATKAAVVRFSTATSMALDSATPTPEMLTVLKLATDGVCKKAVAGSAELPATDAVAAVVAPAAIATAPKVTSKKVVKTKRKSVAKSRTVSSTSKSAKKRSTTGNSKPKKVASTPKKKKKKATTTATSAPQSQETTTILQSAGGGGGGDSGGGSGGGSSGGGSSGGGGWSDARLKTGIAKVGMTGSGLTLYRFSYIWSDTVYVGVMAQDLVAAGRDDAVTVTASGFMKVDYEKLGLRMVTYDAWRRQGPAAVAN